MLVSLNCFISLANKTSQITGLLGRLKKILPTNALKTIYSSLLMSHIQYGIELWGGSSNKNKKRIIISQKKAIRFICKSHGSSHTCPRMKQLRLLNFTDQHHFQCIKLAHDIINKTCPYNIQNKLNLSTNSYDYSLRSTTGDPLELREVLVKQKYVRSGFTTLGSKLWNNLPSKIKEIENRTTFRSHLKKHYLDKYNNVSNCKNPLCKDKKFHSK